MKNSISVGNIQIFAILMLFLILYLPYIVNGGFLLDDLGFINPIKEGTSYIKYQKWMSSFVTMTARPVSALLHGFSYWNFGINYQLFHALNLALFLSSILLFYFSIGRTISYEVAFLTAIFCLTYPGSSSTTFSSLMMNSNLSASLYALALLVSTYKIRFGYIYIFFALVLSALSYEAFIPLFLFIPFSGFLQNQFKIKGSKFIYNSIPVIGAIFTYFLYKKYFEHVIFGTDFTRVRFFTGSEYIERIKYVLNRTHELTTNHLFTTTITSLKNISPVDITISLGVAVLIGVCLSFQSGLLPTGHNHKIRKLLRPISWETYLKYLIFAIVLFYASTSIYLFSGYLPIILGFENRTLGGYRFSTSLALSVFILFIFNQISNKKILLCYIFAICSLCLFLQFSIIGQSKAWIAAYNLNQKVLTDFQNTIIRNPIDFGNRLNIIFIMPESFPEDVNEAPSFQNIWDISASLKLIYKNIDINAIALKKSRLNVIAFESDRLTTPNGEWASPVEKAIIYDYSSNHRSQSLFKLKNVEEYRKFLLSSGFLQSFAGKSILQTGDEINFDDPQFNFDQNILTGWGKREKWGIWSVENKAVIALPSSSMNSQNIEFTVRAFITKAHPSQTVEIWVDGMQQKTFILSKYDDNKITISIPMSKTQKLSQIEFRLPDAISPSALGISIDQRKLGIGLIKAAVQ